MAVALIVDEAWRVPSADCIRFWVRDSGPIWDWEVEG